MDSPRASVKISRVALVFGIGRADHAVGRAVRADGFDVINLPGLVADHDDVGAALDDFFDGVRLEIDHRNAAGRGDDHALAVGRERVQIEIKALAARLGGKLHDAMAGVGINPLQRGGRSVGARKTPLIADRGRAGGTGRKYRCGRSNGRVGLCRQARCEQAGGQAERWDGASDKNGFHKIVGSRRCWLVLLFRTFAPARQSANWPCPDSKVVRLARRGESGRSANGRN